MIDIAIIVMNRYCFKGVQFLLISYKDKLFLLIFFAKECLITAFFAFYFFDSQFWVARQLSIAIIVICRGRFPNEVIPILGVLMLRLKLRAKVNRVYLQILSNHASASLDRQHGGFGNGGGINSAICFSAPRYPFYCP
jgi:hypothetical protein